MESFIQLLVSGLATGAIYDSGDYPRALDLAVQDGQLEDLKRRRDQARAAGRLYGIGYTAAVEPSVSNMGYITTVLTAAERRKSGPKNGAQATATVTLDPVGSATGQVASAPQGQGHRTVLAQVVADVFGLPKDKLAKRRDDICQPLQDIRWNCPLRPNCERHPPAARIRPKPIAPWEIAPSFLLAFKFALANRVFACASEGF